MDGALLVFAVILGFTVAPPVEAGESISLPSPTRRGTLSIEEALQRRRSVRELGSAKLTIQQISQLAWAAQGITNPDGLRTAPSAGALYPLELVIVANRVSGLEPGCYRYVPPRHALTRIEGESDAVSKELARAALGQEWIASAPAIFVVTGVEQRTEQKYGARARRYVMIEVGCAAQNLLLQAVALGLTATPVGAFSDRQVVGILKLGTGESPALIVPVGRPR